MLCAALAIASVSVASAAATPTPAPAAAGTPPPEIYHGVSRPLCSALQTKIRPAIGMMLQNDQTIAQSPPLFKDYISGQSSGSSSRSDFAVFKLNQLVTPLVNNILAIQKLLEDPTIFPPNPSTDDDKRLAKLKSQMFTALADQQAALDIINGFVDTQQLGDMQHEGFGYISSLTNGGIAGSAAQSQARINNQMFGPTPDPLHPQVFDNTALNAGLSPNPNELDLANIPGLELGYNPLGRLKEGVEWTQAQSKTNEAALANTVLDTVRQCEAQSATPSPSPNP